MEAEGAGCVIHEVLSLYIDVLKDVVVLKLVQQVVVQVYAFNSMLVRI